MDGGMTGELKTWLLTLEPLSRRSRFSFQRARKKKNLQTCTETEMVRWEMVCTMRKMEEEKEKKEGIKRNRSEVRWTEERDFSEREHKVIPRSLRHTGFDTPTASSWPSPARYEPKSGCARWTACSPSSPLACALLTVIKTVQSGLQIPGRRKAPVTRGNLPNNQKERLRMNHIGPDNHTIFSDVYLRAQRC